MRKMTTLVQFAYTPFVPLATLYLAEGLERAGVPVDIKIFPLYKNSKHYPFSDNDMDGLYSFLAKSKRILSIGCYSDMLPFLLLVLGRIKKDFPEKTIILGGVGPSEVAEEIIRKFAFVDYVLKGCGVQALPRLIKKIAKGDTVSFDIDGLVYREQGIVVSNHVPRRQMSISRHPAYHCIKNIRAYSQFGMFTSLGCPYQCTFCNMHRLGPQKVELRDLDQIIEEIACIKQLRGKRGFRIDFFDEGFVLDRKRVISFCKLLLLKNFDFSWSCYGRVNHMDEELLKIMAKSGCRYIFYGVESGSNDILKRTNKGFSIDGAVKALEMSGKYINTVIASFIYLYPFETCQDFDETMFFASYLKVRGIKVQLHRLLPFKSSEIYHEFKENLKISDKIMLPCKEKLSALSGQCSKLIKENSDIFYYYYYYDFLEFDLIVKKARSYGLTLFSDVL